MKTISAKELDEKFDNGEDISEYLDWDNAKRGAGLTVRSVYVDLPADILDQLDAEASRSNVSRDDLVSRWVRERLEKASAAAAE